MIVVIYNDKTKKEYKYINKINNPHDIKILDCTFSKLTILYGHNIGNNLVELNCNNNNLLTPNLSASATARLLSALGIRTGDKTETWGS